MNLIIKELEKNFGSWQALNNINLEVAGGELLALLGPSGCGKTTLLRIIAGLERADKGQIFFDNKDVTHINITKRQVGMVFQNYALFRHMTVFANIAFGLKMKVRRERLNKSGISRKVRELLQLVQLERLENSYPAQLSGGQKQRIALARALAAEPKILLLDEPFGALDTKVRKELRLSVRNLQRQLGITCILVTHDQEEALAMADKIVLMQQGKINQIGSGRELYNHPGSAFAARFLGEINIFAQAGIRNNELVCGSYRAPAPKQFSDREERVTVYVRPEDIILSHELLPNYWGEAVIADIQEIGAQVRLFLDSSAVPLPIQVLISRQSFTAAAWRQGQKVYIKPEKTFVFTDNAA